MTWLLDLDGVLWLSGKPLPGSAGAVERLRSGGQRVVFFTNNSAPTIADHVNALAKGGVVAAPEEILSSAQAAAALVEEGSTAAFLGGPGIPEALAARGVEVVAPTDRPQAVVVGLTTELSYEQLTAFAAAIRAGSRFIATNTDATMPTPNGPVPGAGAIVAFLRVASGAEPVVAGKPSKQAAALVAERVGPVEVSVGDRPETDGIFAQLTSSVFALVLSGVTRSEDLPVEPRPDVVGQDLAAIVDEILH